VTLFGSIGVINYQVGSTLEEDAFVVGDSTPPGMDQFPVATLYLDYWNGVSWSWVTPTPTPW